MPSRPERKLFFDSILRSIRTTNLGLVVIECIPAGHETKGVENHSLELGNVNPGNEPRLFCRHRLTISWLDLPVVDYLVEP